MKKYNKKTIYLLGFISGLIVSLGITVYALTYYATDVIYKNKTVDEALNELYSKSSVYGVKRQISSSSSSWERIDASVGLVANAQIGEAEVQNDFDNIYPWSDIITVDLNHDGTENSRYDGTDEWFTNATGEIMTYIPEFYYKREQINGYEYISISKIKKETFSKSDAFYIGRYTTSTGTHSKSGVTPQVNTTITDFRNQAKALGTNWQQLDYHIFIIQLLYLVEYADYNSQAKLGLGNTNNSSTINSGGCNALGMKSGTLNNDGKNSVIYRGIEDIFGNVWQFVDGINVNNGKVYISYTPSKYAVDKFDDSYSAVYTLSSSRAYISKLGYSSTNTLVSLPIEVNGSASTYITDYYYHENSGSRIAVVGGYYGGGTYDTDAFGMWTWSCSPSYVYYVSYFGSRLLKIV